MEPPDFSNKYNTPLPKGEEEKYKAWLRSIGHDPKEVYDYDLQGAYLANLKADDRGHLDDKFKKPNHTTFSEGSIYNNKDGFVGGKWIDKGNDKYDFVPSSTNLKFRDRNDLASYFKKYEPDSRLVLPKEQGNTSMATTKKQDQPPIPRLDTIMNPTLAPEGTDTTQDWQSWFNSHPTRMALGQLGVSLLSGLGSDTPIGQQLGEAVANTVNTYYGTKYPQFNPQVLQAQRLMLEAQKPAFEAYMEGKQFEHQGDIINKQTEAARVKAQLEQEGDIGDIGRREALAKANAAREQALLGMRTSADVSTLRLSDELAQNREKQRTINEQYLAEKRAVIDIGKGALTSNGIKFNESMFNRFLDNNIMNAPMKEDGSPNMEWVIKQTMDDYTKAATILGSPSAPPQAMPPVVQ